MQLRLSFIIFFSLLIGKLNAQVLVGPYAPPAGQNGSTAIHKDSSVFVSWATSTVINRGWQDISDTTLGKTSVGNDSSAVGIAGTNGVVSLGDGGFATANFSGTIYDGLGADFAVFENGFGTFLELAFVEVSSDGVNFFRFDAVSLTDTNSQIGSFGALDATEIHNLAGKYEVNYGVPFDLNELTGIAGLDINAVSHVRIVDVVGNIQEPFATYDDQGNPVNDPWPTPFASGGFDLDAIGVIHLNPVSVKEIQDKIVKTIYPNPFKNHLYLQLNDSKQITVSIFTINGIKVYENRFWERNIHLDLIDLKQGVYFINIVNNDKVWTHKIIKN